MTNRTAPAECDDESAAMIGLLAALRNEAYTFVTVSPVTHARVVARPGRETAGSLQDVFGWSRPFAAGTLPDTLLDLMRRAGVLVADGALMRSTIRVSSLGDELFAHSAYPTHEAESVFFGPDTYRFANAILAWLQPDRAAGLRRVVDIGTGAGPGGILVAKAAPRAEVVLVDVNEAALRLARLNAAAAGVSNAETRRSDVLSGLDGRFDLIVSNPPYLNDPRRRAYRHGGGKLGAALSVRILHEALERLAPDGTLILYTGVAILNGHDPFRGEVEKRSRATDLAWTYREIDPDVFGEELETDAYREADRIAVVVLVATAKG